MATHRFGGGPVEDAAQFIGREREVVQLSELLAAGRSGAVIGPEGGGKTSLLQHIGQAAALVLDIPPDVVAIDLRGVRTAADFYAPILRALGAPGDDELALGQVLAGHPQAGPRPPLLLLLDNLEAAGAGWSGLVRSALRGWIREGALQVVAASAQGLDRAAPDMQTALLQLNLPPMPEREARALVADLAARAGITVPSAAAGEIVGVAGGYPNRIKRALDLWDQSNNGAGFDWRRTFREEFPQQAVLDDSLRGFAPAVETAPEEPQAAEAGAPWAARATLRERLRDSQKPRQRTYRADDPGAFLWMLILVSLAIGVWWAIGSWWGALGFVATLLVWVGLASALVRFGGERWRSNAFVGATRLLPLVGRYAPR